MDWPYIFFSAGEYGVILPAAIFCLFPVRSHLKTRLSPTLFLGAVSAGVVVTCLSGQSRNREEERWQR